MLPDPAPAPTGHSPAARRLHPASPFLGLVAIDPRAAISLGAVALTGRRAWLFGVALLAMLLWQIVEWWRTSYHLDERQLVVSSGVLNRTVKIVAPDRVQQVEIVRRLRHRVFGLTSLRIELAEAGSTDRAIVLDALSATEGARVQGVLERARRGTTPDGVEAGGPLPPPRPAPTMLLRVPWRLLAIGGLTGAPVLLVPVAVFTFLDELRELGGDRLDPGGLRGVALAVAAVAAVAVWAVVAAGQMIVRHAGLALTRDGDEIQVVRGLLERRTSVIPLRRVQLVEVSATAVRRVCRLATIDIRTAGQLELEGTGSLDNAVPIIGAADVAPVLGVLLGRAEPPLPDRTHPAAARWASLLRRLPYAALPVAGLALIGRPGATLAAAVVGLIAIGAGATWWQRSLAHGGHDGVLVARAGVWNRSVRYAPVAKAQSLTFGQGPIQRRLRLVTVRVQLAGGSTLVVSDVSPAQANRVFVEVLGRPQPGFRRLVEAATR